MSVFGDLPTRLLKAGLRGAPWFLEPWLVAVWTLVLFLAAREQRRAVCGNLAALFPAWGRLRRIAGAYRVFWNFAMTYVDAMRVETGTGEVDWVIEGLGAFEQLSASREGCIVLTAHTGNYDMAAPMFAERFGRTVYAVRAPERNSEMQRIMEERLRERERRHPRFRSLYNRGGGMLGVELARLLDEGSVVAVQGDRVLFEVASMDVELGSGLVMSLPKGPLYLARVSGAPVYPLFILRDGWRRYRVTVSPALELPPRLRGAAVDPAAAPWAEALLGAIRANWMQWFVFEPVFRRKEGGGA